MRIAIHQPQYLPWLPYFLKIEACDCFVLLDIVNFQKNGLQNRNQIKTAQGAHWLTVPVLHQFGQKIKEVKVNQTLDWCRKHWYTISQCYRKSTAFNLFEGDLHSFYSQNWLELSELNIQMIYMFMKWMNIQTPVVKASELKATGVASDLILKICIEMGATSYLSGLGGKDYLKPIDFEKAGIEIIYQSFFNPLEYPQLFSEIGFIEHLSVLDLLLNCGNTWRKYLPMKMAVL